MATMTCAVCGRDIGDGMQLRCACGADLTRGGAVVSAEAAVRVVAACAIDGCARAPIHGEAHCDQHLAGLLGARDWTLRAAWGSFVVLAGTEFGLGRSDGFSPVASFLQRDLPVSRRHAILRSTAEGLLIVDIGSTSGTLINGVDLEPHVEHPLVVRDVVRLARTVDILVEGSG